MIKLDKKQKEVVNSDKENILVVAASGSGKTLVLTQRVEKLLRDGVSPHNIVCITFTNMAASEMKERLKDVPGIGEAFIGTIHSFANQVYKESGMSYRIRTTEVELDIYRELLPNTKGYQGTGGFHSLTFERLMSYMDIQELFERGEVSEEAVKSFLLPSEAEDMDSCSIKLSEICKQRNILSFDELLEITRRYFHEIGANLDYLLVDEFQDVGRLESRFITGLKATNNFFVADPRQAIYGFKGGDVNIFLDLMNNPDYVTYNLNNNYRSAKEIIREADIVIRQADVGVDTEVKVKNNKKGSVRFGSKYNLNNFLLEIKNKGDFKDWFILTRTNQQIYEVINALEELEIPYVTFKRNGMNHTDMDEILSTDTVKVLTVHVSKGLENKNVLMYGSFPQHVPSYRLNKDERKVMYVGMTRAEENLIVLN